MVEKMKLLHITGPKYDIDRVMKRYLTKYDIHFENAMTSLGNISNVRPFIETNIYRDIYNSGKELLGYLEPAEELEDMSVGAASEILKDASEHTEQILKRQRELTKRNQELSEFLKAVSCYRNLDFEFSKLLEFEFIKFRMGRIPREYYHKLDTFIRETPYTLFCECYSDENYVWGLYFVPYIHAAEMDAVYLSFHFEQLYVPGGFTGTPEEGCEQAEREMKENREEITRLSEKMREMLKSNRLEILSAYHVLEDYCDNFEIRKMAACTKPKHKGEYYILYGWMSGADADAFQKEIAGDENIHCILENVDGKPGVGPPTKLKNPKILKPFEMFVEMYGLPAYNEMDPTLFVALTYTLMFGIMFGDVGQGLVLAVGGFLLYRIKGMRLAGILSFAGVWSVVFGFLYGSFFGFEDLLAPIWMRPMDNIMETLMTAIAFGGILILIAMILNMINAVRAREYGRLIFDQSGIAGFICYGFVALCIVLFATGHPLPAAIIMGLTVGLPLLAILLKEPLGNWIERRKPVLPAGSKAMYLVEALVECFDVVLSYATNTISFVRVGAFALSHAGMMGVVLTLAGFEKGTPNWLVVVLGNILVAGLEGLVVGIQVLRLEYYEMFSRFYKGSGKPFVPFKKRRKTS